MGNLAYLNACYDGNSCLFPWGNMEQEFLEREQVPHRLLFSVKAKTINNSTFFYQTTNRPTCVCFPVLCRRRGGSRGGGGAMSVRTDSGLLRGNDRQNWSNSMPPPPKPSHRVRIVPYCTGANPSSYATNKRSAKHIQP